MSVGVIVYRVITVLVATAPALSFLLDGGKEIISFDRCCHLVFDDADVLIKEHGEATRKLFQFYQESVRRTSGKSLTPRQVNRYGQLRVDDIFRYIFKNNADCCMRQLLDTWNGNVVLIYYEKSLHFYIFLYGSCSLWENEA